ncbi:MULTISPECIES: BRO family protein [unclassified Clostridium]|nr:MULTISPECIES: BRO family protein [unclassified Clostridium]
MEELQIFKNEQFGQVRMVEIKGRPYAVGIDIAKALDYSNPSKAIINHCKGITKLGIPSEGGVQETNIIPEGDIYRLVVKAADQSKNLDIKQKAE